LYSFAKYNWNDQVREDEMSRVCSTNGEKGNAYRILVVKPEGRSRRRWEGNIKMDHREKGWDGMDWIDLAVGRDHWGIHRNRVMNLWVP
jgi:hypothetical protein